MVTKDNGFKKPWEYTSGKKEEPTSTLSTKLLGTADVQIEEGLYRKIKQLCNTVHNKEWSAILFYKVERKIVDEEEEIYITCKDLYLCDIGTTVNTQYTINPDCFKYITQNKLEDFILGSIHSHHNMSTFFSAQDDKDLQSQIHGNNMYLSLIVNNREDYDGKLATILTLESNGHYLNEQGTKVELSGMKEQYMGYYDCDIYLPITRDQSLSERIKELEKKNIKPTSSVPTKAGFKRVVREDDLVTDEEREFFGVMNDKANKFLQSADDDFPRSSFSKLW